MKKQTVSFQFDTMPAPFRPLRLTDAAAGVLLLAGIWGLLWQCLRPESVPGLLGLGALAALGLAAGLLLRWDRKWQRAALCGALLVLLAAGILLRSHISAALAGLGDLWGQWRFQQTGRYLSARQELLHEVKESERQILETFANLRQGEKIVFGEMSGLLFEWSQGWVKQLK